MAVLAFSLVSQAAVAGSMRAKHASSVRVAVRGHREAGFGLRGTSRGWRLDLGRVLTAVELVDVTDGAVPSRWVVEAVDGALTLDPERFLAGHAYRVELRSGESMLVYLYPPSVSARSSRAERLVFGEESDDVSDDGIAISPKSAL